MRLLKLTTVKNSYTITAAEVDEKGEPVPVIDEKTGEPLVVATVERLEPEGYELRTDIAPCDSRGLVESEVQLVLVPDEDIRDDDPRRAGPADVPILRAPGHPLDGLPVLPVVISGMRDSGVDDRGRVLPYDMSTGLLVDPDAVVEPVEPKPADDAELIRA